MGPGTFEVKLEAGTRPVELSSGDYIHFYAAVACNEYVKRGNYTVGAWEFAQLPPPPLAAAVHCRHGVLCGAFYGRRLDGAGQR